jgi:hypothetical protein
MSGSTQTGTPTRTRAGTFAAVREPGDALSREELSRMLSDVVKILHTRVTAGRFVEKKTDSAFMGLVRGLVQAASTLDGVIKNSDLQSIEERLAVLEERRARESPRK